MTAFQHVYVTVHGRWSSGPWAGEAGQFGLRLCTVPTLAAPEKGKIFAPSANGDVVLDQGVQVGTHGTLTRVWTGRIGPLGSEDNWDAAYQVDIAEDIWAYLDATKALHATLWQWTHVKQAAISSAGAVIEGSSTYTFTTPVQGTTASTLPPQVSAAISLRANIPGRRGRGRIYLPGLAQTWVSADGTIPTTPATTARTALKALVDNLQDPPGTPDQIPIVSLLSPGAATAVRPAEIRTGNRLDTIQSRRRQVAEAYTALPL